MILASSNSMIVILAIAVFLALILGLIVFLQISAKFMVKQGKVKISINGDREVEVDSGSSLLNALTDKGIKLPSACGGGGSCSQCRCIVTEGGGELLPTEAPHFSLKEKQQGLRLSCQVKVRNDMKIEVDHHVFGTKSWECEVVSNDNVATFIKEFVVRLPPGENLNFRAGGYIQIEIPEYKDLKFSSFDIPQMYRGDWDNFMGKSVFALSANNDAMVERAYSMANHPAEGNIVMLNVRIATPPWDRDAKDFKPVNPGKSSSYIFSRKAGDKVRISGPFGEFFMKDTNREVMFIGGGAGMAPMRSHIFDLFHTKKTTRKASFWYGARSMKEMFYDEDFKTIEKQFPNFKYYVALSDKLPEDEGKWIVKKDINDTEGTGFRGFIHQVILEQYLKNHEAPEEIEYYMCGPPMMNNAVKKMLADLGVEPEMIALDDFGG